MDAPPARTGNQVCCDATRIRRHERVRRGPAIAGRTRQHLPSPVWAGVQRPVPASAELPGAITSPTCTAPIINNACTVCTRDAPARRPPGIPGPGRQLLHAASTLFGGVHLPPNQSTTFLFSLPSAILVNPLGHSSISTFSSLRMVVGAVGVGGHRAPAQGGRASTLPGVGVQAHPHLPS